jgi:hypothetical protein
MRPFNLNKTDVFNTYRSAFLLGAASAPREERSQLPERYRWSDDRIRKDLISQDMRAARANWLKSLFGR